MWSSSEIWARVPHDLTPDLSIYQSILSLKRVCHGSVLKVTHSGYFILLKCNIKRGLVPENSSLKPTH